MGTMPIGELFQRYVREDITDQQALGHILQNLVQMEKSLAAQEKEIEALKQEVERLRAFVGMEGQ
jgi:hypothetical protein